MASTTSVGAERAEHLLEYVAAMVNDLAGVAEEWTTLTDAERASWSLDWDLAMCSNLREIERLGRRGTLPPDQHARFQAILDTLATHQPTIVRLGIAWPAVPLRPNGQRE
jgi:hypothetical protein